MKPCSHCGKPILGPASRVNRAVAAGLPLFCGRVCFGLSRRLVNPPTEAERKSAKRLYDERRRIEKSDEIKAWKRAYYQRTKNPERERINRAKTMHRHVEYCRRPEYRAWKKEYDKSHCARKQFGQFAEAALILRDLETEVEQRASRYEIGITNGTINKAQLRKRAL